MSLIADALKAAQKEKARRAPPPRAPQQSYFPFRFPTRSSGEPMVSPLVIGIGVATAAIALTALVLMFRPSSSAPARPAAAAPSFADSVPTEMVLETPGDPATQALLDVPADNVELPPEFEAYDEPAAPPQRTAPRASPPREAPAPARAADRGESDALPPSLTSSRETPAQSTPSRAQPSGRLQITVDQPITSSSGGGLFEQGLAAQRRGDFETAKNRYLQATYENPRNPDLWNNLGTAYRALGDLSGAEAAFRQATEVDPRFAPAWSNRGVVLAQQGRVSEAITSLQEAVRLDPSNAGAKVNLAIQLHGAGAVADARKLLEEALRMDPALAEAHYELGRVLEKQGDVAGAMREYSLFLSTAGGRFPELDRAVRARLRRLAP